MESEKRGACSADWCLGLIVSRIHKNLNILDALMNLYGRIVNEPRTNPLNLQANPSGGSRKFKLRGLSGLGRRFKFLFHFQFARNEILCIYDYGILETQSTFRELLKN